MLSLIELLIKKFKKFQDKQPKRKMKDLNG